MKKGTAAPETIRLLRQAEDRLRDKVPTTPHTLTLEEAQRLHHELQVHQLELELQNEELRQAKNEADEMLERFVELYDFAPVGYVTLDYKGTIRAVNITGAALLGEDRSALIGRPFKFFVANSQPAFPGFLEKVFAVNDKQYCEATLRSEGKATLSVRIEALVSSSGKECRAALIDVTELRQKDFLLITQNRLAAMGEMINNIAHQWRKPLNTLGLTIQQFVIFHDHDQLNREALEEGVGKSMELINHMSQTIEDFRNYFRPDKEQVTFKIHDVVMRALVILEENLSKQRIRVDIAGNDACSIHGYPNELLQVLLNILINAIDAMTGNAVPDLKITITLGTAAHRAVITIADNAGGIPTEIMGQIFDPFVTTKEPGMGTGIGLYLSKTIVERSMKGSLTARNVPSGAEFRIEI